jgi:outer membrane lipoprotein-sorting protein
MQYFRIGALLGIALISGTSMAAAKAPAPLTEFASTWASMSGYKTEVHCFSVKGSETENSSYNYSFTKPSSITMTITSGPRSGSTVTWSGGDTVTGGKGMFTKKFSLTDPAVTSLRGATIVDLSFGSILNHAESVQGTKSAASTTLDGAAVHVVTIAVANPSSDNGLTREALYLSPSTNLPVRVDGFEESKLVSSCSFSKTVKT